MEAGPAGWTRDSIVLLKSVRASRPLRLLDPFSNEIAIRVPAKVLGFTDLGSESASVDDALSPFSDSAAIPDDSTDGNASRTTNETPQGTLGGFQSYKTAGVLQEGVKRTFRMQASLTNPEILGWATCRCIRACNFS